MSTKTLLILFAIIFLSGTAAIAQTDSLKKDSLKTDTTLINKYRAEPAGDALPVRTRPLNITPELVAVNLPDYTISYWHKSIVFNLNFSQAAFTGNWTGGGVSSVALNTNFDFKAEYNKAPLDYTTELNLVYGTSVVKGQGTRKTNDLIYYDNKIATNLSKKWLFFGSINFQSQFSNGYNYPGDTIAPQKISGFMAPGYLTESVGFEYKPSKVLQPAILSSTSSHSRQLPQ
jgi:hypothetical protein